jgi:hypothetical protein
MFLVVSDVIRCYWTKFMDGQFLVRSQVLTATSVKMCVSCGAWCFSETSVSVSWVTRCKVSKDSRLRQNTSSAADYFNVSKKFSFLLFYCRVHRCPPLDPALSYKNLHTILILSFQLYADHPNCLLPSDFQTIIFHVFLHFKCMLLFSPISSP